MIIKLGLKLYIQEVTILTLLCEISCDQKNCGEQWKAVLLQQVPYAKVTTAPRCGLSYKP